MFCASAMPSAIDLPSRMAAITTFVVEFSTPVNPWIFKPGSVFRTMLKIGAPSITVASKRNSTPAARASSRSAA